MDKISLPAPVRVVPVVPNGVYSVDCYDGTGNMFWVVLRLLDNHIGAAQASQLAAWQKGPHHIGKFIPFAHVNGTDVRLWADHQNSVRRRKALETLVHAKPDELERYVHQYEISSGKCSQCLRRKAIDGNHRCPRSVGTS